ncbi:MAG TPA: Rieske (2Fe-2S) protein [Chloroflexi bacterium]|nr:Rieske (2Fe-2S) protein [Chloroflexota bacterium]
MSTSHEKTTPIHRRDFLKLGGVALGGLLTFEIGGVVLRYMTPRQTEGEFGGVITAGAIDDFPPGSVTHIPNGRFYLSRLTDGGFLALYQRCTHLGCTVPWRQEENKFICPCHNSQFTAEGALLNPPAPRPLDLFRVFFEDGMVKVDTSKPISRAAFEPSQVVYP